MLIITTRGKRNHQYVVKLASDDVCCFLIQYYCIVNNARNNAWLLLFNLLKPDSLKCPGFVWEPLFASATNKSKYTNIQKCFLHLQIYLLMECKDLQNAWKSSCNFLSVLLLGCQILNKMLNFVWFFPLWNALEIIRLTRELNIEEQNVCYLLRRSCFLILTIFWF